MKIIIIGGVLLSSIFLSGLDKQEIVDCLSWQHEASQYSGFFLASWQKAQCDAHGISIDAPVK